LPRIIDSLLQDGTKANSGHTPSASISSINSFSFLDAQRQDYFDMSKKGSSERDNDASNSIHVLLVFDNLNNLYKRLSVLAIEQQQPNLVSEHVTSRINPRHSLVDQYKQRWSQWHVTIDVIDVDDYVSTWIDIL
jgi:hypothetical protein